jgi:acyl-CoA synthetase (AMP-forming)/AMP-acid ligase II
MQKRLSFIFSGSTGLPKGVKLLHRAAFMRVHWQWSILPFRANFIKLHFGRKLYGKIFNLKIWTNLHPKTTHVIMHINLLWVLKQ